MAMSRRKQPHPKSLKDVDETVFVLPAELQCDEESHEILARLDLEEGHRFGPFPATTLSCPSRRLSSDSETSRTSGQIDHQRTPAFQLTENQHNWLVRCSSLNSTSAVNLHLLAQDEQIFAVLTESIPAGRRLCTASHIYPKVTLAAPTIKVKEEPMESDDSSVKSESPSPIKTKRFSPLVFTCDECGIRFSNRSTLEAHRSHYCPKRDPIPSVITTTTTAVKSQSTDSLMPVRMKSIKRKHTDISPSTSSNKRLSLLSSKESYCSECDILFSKAENFLQHKLYYCGKNASSLRSLSESNAFRAPVPFDRPIQIGQFIYVPVPIVPSTVDLSSSPPIDELEEKNNKPLDLSKPKKTIEEGRGNSTSPLDLTMDKPSSSKAIPVQIHECEYCSIRFSSLKTLHAHQESYCLEYRKQKKNNNESKSTVTDSTRSQSPPSTTNSSKSASLSPLDSVTHLLPHRLSPFMCRLCKYRGNTLRGMRMHFKFHLSNNEPCSDDDIIVTSTLNSSPTLVSSQSLLKCTICSAMFDHEETLVNHMKCVHTRETLLECLECQSRFCSKWNLLRHMKLTHTNIKCEDEQEEEEKKDEDEPMLVDPTHSTSNDISPPEENEDEEIDLSSPTTKKEKCSDPVNLTRHVLIESLDMNSSAKLPSALLMKKKFACPYCHIKFGSIDTLKQHMTNYCSSRPTSTDEPATSPPPKKKPAGNASNAETYCSSCQIPFRQRSSYEAHKMYYCRASHKAHVKMQA